MVLDLSTRRDPFSSPGRWYRGNLHTHTTASDGRRSPEEAAAWYREHSYDFVAITDHHDVTPVAGLAGPGFLVLPGEEAHPGLVEVGEPYHLAAAGVVQGQRFGREDDPQAAVDAMRGAGAVVWLAHPHWLGLTLPEMARLQGVAGLEVYNATCTRFGKGTAASHWDDLLARGRLVWGLAVDDTHWEAHDWGQGWVMVRAEELSAPAILGALAAGSFYASQGPEIHDLVVTSQEVYVRCSPARSIICISVAGTGDYALAEDPQQLLTEARFPLRHERVYVRVECTDAQGRTAWSQPYLL